MSRLFYHVMQDNVGNLLFDVSGTMRLAGTGTAATIYGDEALTVPIANPMTNHPSFGSFKCFLGVGDYDFYMAKSGYTFETLTGVQGSGSMADQNANAVGITGGTVQGITSLLVAGPTSLQGSVGIGVAAPAGTNRLQVDGLMSVQTAIDANVVMNVLVNKSAQFGMVFKVVGSDTGNALMQFFNLANANVGGITTTATATSFNTSSDARLKQAVTPLTGALDVVRALNPVSFRWRADDTPGRGFLAHEVAEVIDGVITGEVGAIDAEGNIEPQQIDYSKLVPWLVSAVKELTQQVEMLQAQLAATEA
jgi:hypothetical protein